MDKLTLIVGTKKHSSWSLRPWIAARQAGIPFAEIVIPLGRPETKAAILAHSPAGRVPVLEHGPVTVWESLAICEYLAETFPDVGLWPADGGARAVARAVSAEMHSGFARLREHMPMDIGASRPGEGRGAGVAEDIERILAIWEGCRRRFGRGGPFLFGGFSNADAMYVPVVTRFRTYAVDLPPACRDYAEAIWNLPAMREWVRAATA